MMVAPYFYPKTGGLENYVWNVSKELKKKYKIEIIVVTSNHEKKAYKIEKIFDIKVYRLPPLLVVSNTPINPLWYLMIRNIIESEKPDLINAHAPVPFIADVAAIASHKIPFFLTYHAGTMKKGSYLADIIIGVYEKFFLPHLFERAKIIICCSKFVQNTVVRKYRSKSHVIYPGVDLSLFKPKRFPYANKQKSVLFIGRHANVYGLKGLYWLIDVVSKIPDVKLKVVGERLNVNKRNVVFVGVKEGKELVNEIQNSSIVVLPSLFNESFGMVLVEAMACKVPVIGTITGGIPEVIDKNKYGILVRKNDSSSLNESILGLLHNQSLARQIAERAYRKVTRDNKWSIKTEQTYNLYNENIQKK